MGQLAKFEFTCFTIFVARFERLPELNDKKKSPDTEKQLADWSYEFMSQS